MNFSKLETIINNSKNFMAKTAIASSALMFAYGCSEEPPSSPIPTPSTQDPISDIQKGITDISGKTTFYDENNNPRTIWLRDNIGFPINNAVVTYESNLERDFEAFHAFSPFNQSTNEYDYSSTFWIQPIPTSNLRESSDLINLELLKNNGASDVYLQTLLGVDVEAFSNYLEYKLGKENNCFYFVDTFPINNFADAYNTQTAMAIATANLTGSGGLGLAILSTVRNEIGSNLDELLQYIPDSIQNVDVFNLDPFQELGIPRNTSFDVILPSNSPWANINNTNTFQNTASLELLFYDYSRHNNWLSDPAPKCVGTEDMNLRFLNDILKWPGDIPFISGELIGTANIPITNPYWNTHGDTRTFQARPNNLTLPPGTYRINIITEDENGNSHKSIGGLTTISDSSPNVLSIANSWNINPTVNRVEGLEWILGTPWVLKNPGLNTSINVYRLTTDFSTIAQQFSIPHSNWNNFVHDLAVDGANINILDDDNKISYNISNQSTQLLSRFGTGEGGYTFYNGNMWEALHTGSPTNSVIIKNPNFSQVLDLSQTKHEENPEIAFSSNGMLYLQVNARLPNDDISAQKKPYLYVFNPNFTFNRIHTFPPPLNELDYDSKITSLATNDSGNLIAIYEDKAYLLQ